MHLLWSAAELIDGLLQLNDGLRQFLVFLHQPRPFRLRFFLKVLERCFEFVDLCELFVLDALQFRILILKEGDFLLVLHFIPIIIL